MDRDAVAYLTAGDQPEALNVPQGLRVAHTVDGGRPQREGDDLQRGGDPERARLPDALAWIESGRAQVLLVWHLAAVAHSLGELVRLVEWLHEHRAALVALDLALDTDLPAGRLVLDVLHEVQRWTREPESPRRPTGRPGLRSISPELAERIAEMREQGLSLQAIARALNDRGIPTPRGGAEWRPSSVQTVLGYRRPRPPVPGGRHPHGGPRAHGGHGPRPGPGARGKR